MSLRLIKHKLFLYMPVSLERCLTSVLQSTSSTSSSWMGAFSPWKHLNGAVRNGPFSLHFSKVCQEFSDVSWSVNIYGGSNVSTRRKCSVCNCQHHSSLKKSWRRVGYDFKSPLHVPSEVFQELCWRFWNLNAGNARTQRPNSVDQDGLIHSLHCYCFGLNWYTALCLPPL